MGKPCEQDGCGKRPVFGTERGLGRFCLAHKTAEMFNVKTKHCEEAGCELRILYDIPGGKGRFCASHKKPGMINIVHKLCEHTDCKKQPIFGLRGSKMQFCDAHRTTDMLNLKHKRCEYENCSIIQPNFNIKGGKGRFCIKHKTDEMIDVRSTKCKYGGCILRANFDIQGGKGQFCFTHKLPNMYDVNSKRCKHGDCTIRATYNIKGDSSQFCKSHKTKDMVLITNNCCKHEGCEITHTPYNIKGEKKGTYCSHHKTDEMIIVNKIFCKKEACDSTAIYGTPGQIQSLCFRHREIGMIRRPKSKCKEKSCSDIAIWGKNWTSLHCEKHKEEDEENPVEKPCISCNLMYILDKTGKCENCNPDSWKIGRLAKQNALMDYLDGRGLSGISTDKSVDGGICGRERPDRVYDFGDKIVVLECDEHQHQERDCLCEVTRMVNLGQTFGGLPVYFIRWNPDNYSPLDEKKKPEVIKKRYIMCGDLLRDIQMGLTKLPVALVSAIYLYFDGWTGLADEKWKVISVFES